MRSVRALVLPAALFTLAVLALSAAPAALAQACVGCHLEATPQIVEDWKLSKHSGASVGCETCHGAEHKGTDDVAKTKLPTPDTCADCHDTQVAQFKKGKHALAWVSMEAMPTIHAQPVAMTYGMKGCGGCHKLGLKSEADLKKIAAEGSHAFGNASCDACHTRHTFSVKEAKQPQACQTCHMGFDHPQWEMYSASKHGVRALLKQTGTLPATTPAPTCQDCHMAGGNHEVRTAWGFLAVRLPLPEDKQWAADQVTILQGLGVLDPEGKPTGRLEAVKAADIARLTAESWQAERDRMSKVCAQCHSEGFAAAQMKQGDDMIRQADHLMAEAIRSVAALYKERVATLNELADAVHPFYVATHPSAELRAQHFPDAALSALRDLRARLAGAEWQRAALSQALKDTLAATGLKMPQVAIPLRVALLGQPQSPAIDAVLEVLGRDAVLQRLDALL